MQRTIHKNVFFSGITNVADFLQFILMILAANWLAPEGFGMLSTALSLGMVFLAFSDLGMNHLAIRNISRDRSLAGAYLGNILSWKIVLATGAFALLVLTSWVIRKDSPEMRHLVLVIGLSMVFRFFSLSGRCFLHAFERFDIESLAAAIEQLLLVGGGAVLLSLGHGVVSLAGLFLASRVLGTLLTFGMLNRLVPVRFLVNRAFILKHQREALPIGIAFGAVMAYTQMDTLVLSSLASNTEVGIYNAAFKIYNSLLIVPSVICSVLLPRLSRAFRSDPVLFRRLLIQGAAFLAAVSVALGAAGVWLSPWLIGLLYRESYASAVLPMQILFGAGVVTFQVWLLRILLVATDRQKSFMWIYVAGLGVRILTDIVLIRRYGIAGAAWATLVSDVFLLAAMWRVVRPGRSGGGQRMGLA